MDVNWLNEGLVIGLVIGLIPGVGLLVRWLKNVF